MLKSLERKPHRTSRTDATDSTVGPVKRVAPYVLLVGLAAIIFIPGLPRELVGVTAVVMMITMIMLRILVPVAMIVPSILGITALRGWRPIVTAMGEIPYDTAASWSLSVIPMYILMGMLLWRSGITENLFAAARVWISWLPGGLATGTVLAGAGMATISGSTIGTTHALGRISIPEMLKAGYDKRLASGAVLASGLAGQLIPPSLILVIYAGIASVPVGPQLIAGIIPGIVISVICLVQITAIAVIAPSVVGGRRRKGEEGPRTTWSERFRSLGPTWPVPVLVLIVIGGMLSGILTATEAGAMGALGALLFTFWMKRKDRPLTQVANALMSTLQSVGSVFFLIMGAHMLTRLFSLTNLGVALTDWVQSLGLTRVTFLIVIALIYILIGTVMEPMAMMLLTVPLLLPTLAALDISLLWFGVFVVFLGELAIITPPLGILTFIVHSIAKSPEVNQGKDISLKDVIVSVGWLAPAAIVFLAVLIIWPSLATWLPGLM